MSTFFTRLMAKRSQGFPLVVSLVAVVWSLYRRLVCFHFVFIWGNRQGIKYERERERERERETISWFNLFQHGQHWLQQESNAMAKTTEKSSPCPEHPRICWEIISPTHLMSHLFSFFYNWSGLSKKVKRYSKALFKKDNAMLKKNTMKCVLLQGINTVHACCVLNKHFCVGTRALFEVEWLQSSAIMAVYPGGSLRRTFRSSTPSAHQHPWETNQAVCVCWQPRRRGLHRIAHLVSRATQSVPISSAICGTCQINNTGTWERPRRRREKYIRPRKYIFTLVMRAGLY